MEKIKENEKIIVKKKITTMEKARSLQTDNIFFIIYSRKHVRDQNIFAQISKFIS